MVISTPDILVLTKQADKASNLTFLLRLSNFQTIHIADDIEAFNYLVQRQNSPLPISLMLVADADINQPILHLLEELERRNAMLPILLVRRNGPIPLKKLQCSNAARKIIRQCDSSLTHFCVKETLGTFETPVAKVS